MSDVTEQAQDTKTPDIAPEEQRKSLALIYAAFIAGLCSIIYELLIATTTSYFLGDSVKYFSLTIGIYMAAMGVGSYVSKYLERNLLRKFVIAELMLGLLGGLSIPLLYTVFSIWREGFITVFVLLTTAIGFLIGLEIPFLTRLMERYQTLKSNIANILTVDYFGALIATTAFPFVLLPFLGVYQSSLLFGLVNMSIGFSVLWMFRNEIQGFKRLFATTILFTSSLGALMIGSSVFLKHWDDSLYRDRIVFAEQSIYQRLVLTKFKDDVRLFLDGNLQFASQDERRYHESLVHVPVAYQTEPPKSVLLLGAGDGLAVRELVKYPEIEQIIMVDLDPAMVEMAKTNPHMRQINEDSLLDPRVTVLHQDAFAFLDQNRSEQDFDLIISDLPDPNNTALARLYSTHYYKLVKQNLAKDGLFITQATSPYFSTNAFWSINETMKAAGFPNTYPFQAIVASFGGSWGFIMGSDAPLDLAQPNLQVETTYLSNDLFPSLFAFSKDIANRTVAINRLDQPIILDYYLSAWKDYAR